MLVDDFHRDPVQRRVPERFATLDDFSLETTSRVFAVRVEHETAWHQLFQFSTCNLAVNGRTCRAAAALEIEPGEKRLAEGIGFQCQLYSIAFLGSCNFLLGGDTRIVASLDFCLELGCGRAGRVSMARKCRNPPCSIVSRIRRADVMTFFRSRL
jgi:hypothetical protein